MWVGKRSQDVSLVQYHGMIVNGVTNYILIEYEVCSTKKVRNFRVHSLNGMSLLHPSPQGLDISAGGEIERMLKSETMNDSKGTASSRNNRTVTHISSQSLWPKPDQHTFKLDTALIRGNRYKVPLLIKKILQLIKEKLVSPMEYH